MAALSYALKQAWSDLWYRRKMNALILLALVAGLLLPLFSVGRLLSAYTSLRDSNWSHADQIAVVDVMRKFEQERKLQDQFARVAQDAQAVGYSATVRAAASWNGENHAVQLSGVSASFAELEAMAWNEGRLWTQDEFAASEKVCIVKHNGRLGSAVPGDVITLGQETYTVTGVVRDPYLYGDMILPYGCLEPYAQGGAMQYRVLFRFDAPLDTAQTGKMERSLQTQEDVRLLKLQTATQMQDEMKRSLLPVFVFEGAVSAAVLLFSAMGCILMFQGVIENSAASIGARLAVGGTPQLMMLQYLLHNLVLVLCAAVLDICALAVLEQVMQSKNAVPVSLLVGWYFVLCVCLAMVITTVGLRRILRRPIAQLLGGSV